MEVKQAVCYLRELEGKPLLYRDFTDLEHAKYIIEYDHNLFCLLTLEAECKVNSVYPNWYYNPELLTFFRDSHWSDCNREPSNLQYIQKVRPESMNQAVGLVPMALLNIYMKNYVDV